MNQIKIMSLRRDDRCACGRETPRGTRAGWDRTRRRVVCLECIPAPGRRRADVAVDSAGAIGGPDRPGRRRLVEAPPSPVDVGVPGQSLLQEFERRQAKADAEFRRQHPIRSRWFGARAPVERSAQAFQVGAVGEQLIADWVLSATRGRGFWMFNRSLGRRSGDIDALGVMDSGIWIVDAKHYRTGDVTITGDVLHVGGRRRPQITESMWRQVRAVSSTMPQVPLHPMICIVGARLRVPGGHGRVDGIDVVGPDGLARALAGGGPLDAATRGEIVGRLANAFPPAA